MNSHRIFIKRYTAFVLALAGLSIGMGTSPAVGEPDLAEARERFMDEEYAAVVEMLEPEADAEPDDPHLQALLAHAAYELDRYELARQAYRRAIQAGRLGADIVTRLAVIEQEAGRDVAAINALRLASVLDPEHVPSTLALVGLAEQLEWNQEARAVLLEVLAQHPDVATGYAQLGNLYLADQHRDDALRAYTTAYHLGLDDHALMRTVAELHAANEDFHAAAQWYERVLHHAEPDPALQLQLAQMQLHADDLDTAQNTATRLTEEPDIDRSLRADTHLVLAQIAMQRDDIDGAVEHWEEAFEITPTLNHNIVRYLGTHFFHQSAYDRAADHLERYLEQHPHDEQILHMLIVSLHRSDQHAEAKSYLRHYLEHVGRDQGFEELLNLVASQ